LISVLNLDFFLWFTQGKGEKKEKEEKEMECGSGFRDSHVAAQKPGSTAL